MGHTVIIGNGISGVTAARHIRKNSDSEQITIISSESKHFFSRTALMYIYMGHMKFEHTKPYEDGFWKKNRIELVFKHVDSIDYENKSLKFSDNGIFQFDNLILAVGSKWNKFGWPGQELDGVGGLFSYQDLQYIEERTSRIKRAVIVGGGLIGVEMAEMFLSRGIKVTFLVRENRFWGNVLPKEEGALIANHMTTDHHVDLKLNSELKEILDDGTGKVKGIVTASGETIACEFVGLSVGVSPNVEFLKNSKLEVNRGIVINRHLETNIESVYAIGDCAEFSEPTPGRRAMEQVWYTGRMMGEAVAKTIAGNRTKYLPGFWFNSAKFFDIEYQTYGLVPANLPDHWDSFVWQHPTKDLLVHFAFEKTDQRKFVGINTFGIRLRHEVFEKWQQEERPVDYVLEYLKDANFDPEFYAKYEKAIISDFNSKHGTSISPKKKSWTRILNLSK